MFNPQTEGDCDEQLGQRDRAALQQSPRRGLHADPRPHAEEESANQRRGAIFKQCGGKPANLQRLRRKRIDDCADDQRHDHHAAWNSLNCLLDVHVAPPAVIMIK